MRLSKKLFFLCFRPTIKFQGGSPVDPLFDPPSDPPFDSTSQKLWMRLLYLQLRSFGLRFVFFTYGGGTVSKKDQTQFPDGGEP